MMSADAFAKARGSRRGHRPVGTPTKRGRKPAVHSYDDPTLDLPVRSSGRAHLLPKPVQVYRNGSVVVLRESPRSDHTVVEGYGLLTWRETLRLLTEGLIRIGPVEYSLSHPNVLCVAEHSNAGA